MLEYYVLIAVCLLAAGSFTAIGIHAAGKKEPMNFWAGEQLKTSALTDVSSYNRENGKMWMIFSIPWWICFMLSILETVIQSDTIAIVILTLMVLCGTLGLWWLIRTYQSIFKKYRLECSQ